VHNDGHFARKAARPRAKIAAIHGWRSTGGEDRRRYKETPR